jgi:rhodanese-related sulfurtransferase
MKTETVQGATFEEWSPDEVEAALKAGEIVVVDVRTPAEFILERIPGALLAPMAEFDPDSMPTGDRKRIVLHCGSGARSRKVSERCVAAGWTRVAHLEGGMAAWKQAEKPRLATDLATGQPKRVGG